MDHFAVSSATIRGIEAVPVDVEVSIGGGLPGITIVGLPDSAVQEARLRVRSALRATGFKVPPANIVVNLAPSSLRKVGSGFDLPIAVAILVCTGQLNKRLLDQHVFVGELSLDGSVRGTGGLLAVAAMVAGLGKTLVSGPTDEDLSVALPQHHRILRDLAGLREGELLEPLHKHARPSGDEVDFADMAAQDFAKRALQLAAAGNHAMLMVGPPGSGKTMLARRLPTIMPPLSNDERMESALVHSVSGCAFESVLAGKRPFRAPHHSATPAGLLGGGNPPTPGEVSLAHNGILFLDEMPEFGSRVLQMLRQPIEDHQVVLARADGAYRFPARFLLVGAANPCPCGYLGDPERPCTCSPGMVAQYQAKIGGPLKDRFDMMVTVSRSDPKTVLQTGEGVSSRELALGVVAAREFASWRAQRRRQRGEDVPASVADVPDAPGMSGHLRGRDRLLLDECRMDMEASGYLEQAARQHKMSGRGIMKVLSVARTIADMQQRENVQQGDIAEAVMYRTQDKE